MYEYDEKGHVLRVNGVRVSEYASDRTLRDEFAMAALAGMEEKHPPFMAADAYKIADAMMEARKS